MTPNDAMSPSRRFAYVSHAGAREAAPSRERASYLAEKGNLLEATGQLELERALDCFEEALALDVGNDGLELSVNRLQRKLIPRWHFAMLNDSERNECFDRALRQAIGESRCSVLDVGSGTGLLAMMAARAGAESVITCEAVRPIAAQARRIIAANHLDDRVEVIAKMSTDLVVGRDMDERADLLVTETVDCGLLGEGIIPIVRHAREHLLRPRPVIIPARARIIFRLLTSSSIQRNNYVSTAAGFDVSLFNDFSTKTYFPVRLNAHHHDFLSAPIEAFDFDFESGPLSPRTRRMAALVQQSGVVHGIAFWFELDLHGGLQITNAPSNPISHWMQAVQCFERPTLVERGQNLTVECSHDDTTVRFALVQAGPSNLTEDHDETR